MATSVNNVRFANPNPRPRAYRGGGNHLTRRPPITTISPARSETVQFRPLPFYDELIQIVQPTTLQSQGLVGRHNESQIEFKLPIDIADAIAMSKENTHILLRFCCIDRQLDEQDDNFPPNIVISVNDKHVMLAPAISNPNKPNVPPKRPGQHVDITKECKLSPFVTNLIDIKWLIDPTEPSREYACTLVIGAKQTMDTMLDRIKSRGLSDPETTRRLIADNDNEVATTNLQCSLLCPLGKMRMTIPCKSVKCCHIPCFDALIYLQMNERKATWICPVCYKRAYFQDLIIDGFFSDILTKAPHDVTDVILNLDGTWTPVGKTEQVLSTCKRDPNAPELITISDDDD